ncbi:MAG: carbonic anhydrase family protein [Edaphobacter sp.]
MTKRLAIILTVSILAGQATTHSQQAEHPEHHWSYSGKDGPKQWAHLEPDFFECSAGQHQSPINIHTHNAVTSGLPRLEFHYKPSPLTITDNGHTIEVDYAPGSALTIGGRSYELKQFHFHHPSEEHIDGKHFDVVAHLVHRDSGGNTVVVAVLLKAGSSNPLLETLWHNLPPEKEKPHVVPGVSIDLNQLLPASLGYYTFPGSLTTPPCTEIVTWYVLKSPESISSEQVATFATIYPSDARPIQPLHHRQVAQTPY